MGINRSTKMILFYSPQGGTGKSTLAINTSIFFSSFGIKVLLVDMSVYGSVASIKRIPLKGGIGLTAILTLLDLDIENIDDNRLNEVIKSSIVNSGVNKNFDVLLSGNPIKMEAINGRYCKTLIDGFNKLDYDFIIIDTSSELSEKNMLLFENVNYCVVPVIQDISCGWKMVMFREVIDKCRIDKNKFGIIANMCSKYSGFNNMEFEKEIGYEVLAEVPYFAKRYQSFINEGILINLMKNKRANKCFLNTTRLLLNKIRSGSSDKII